MSEALKIIIFTDWVVGLIHGVLNQGSMTVMSFLIRDDAPFNTFLPGPIGIVGIVVMGLLAVYLYQRYEVEQVDVMAVETAVSTQWS